jgi:hypothetical protein
VERNSDREPQSHRPNRSVSRTSIVTRTGPFWSNFHPTKTSTDPTHAKEPANDIKQNADHIYLSSCRNVVETAKSGGIAALLIFDEPGITRHTLDTVLPSIVNGIFSGLPVNHTVKTSILEICGTRCIDLMDPISPSQVRIVDGIDGSVSYVNAMSVACLTPGDLLDSIVAAKGRLSNKPEDACFSRHLLCRIAITPPLDAPTWLRQGKMFLLDGSVKTNNSKYAGVDKSILVLKKCLRANAKDATVDSNKQALFAQSTLTRCLRECLEREDATFQVIDEGKIMDKEEEEDNSTMEDALQTVPHSTSCLSEGETHPPKRWDHSILCDWLVSRHLVQDRAFVPKDLDGRIIMKMNKFEIQKSALCDDDATKADLIYKCLRAETDRVARLDLKRRMAIDRSKRQKG